MAPKISIVMPYYNRKKLLYITLKSINNSSFKDIELIIVDDASNEENKLDLNEKIFKEVSFPIKLMTIKKEDKFWSNPCIPFNIGFKLVEGEIVVLTNPECFHIDDILTSIVTHSKENIYISYGCYSIGKEDTDKIEDIILDSSKELNLKLEYRSVSFDGDNGWYNHSIFRPVGYHFLSAIHKSKLDELGGFDEQFAEGTGYDDDEFLHRVRKMGMEIKIIDHPFVIHQWHYSSSVGDSNKVERNRQLYYNKTLTSGTYKVNQNV